MLEQEFFALLENAGPAFVLDDGAEVRFWNRTAAALLGYSASEAQGSRCYDLLDATGALGTRICTEDCQVLKQACNCTAIPSFDLRVKTKSGEYLWIDVTTLPWRNPRNGRLFIAHLFHDISARKKNENLIEELKAISERVLAAANGSQQPAPVAPLTEHERAILRLFSQGKSSVAVAREMGITQQTVRNHLHRINQKLRTHSRLEAVTHATQRNLL